MFSVNLKAGNKEKEMRVKVVFLFQQVVVKVWPLQARNDSHTRTQRTSTRLKSEKESKSSISPTLCGSTVAPGCGLIP